MVTIKKSVQVVELEAKTLLIHMKVRDTFYCAVQDAEGKSIGNDYEGYVPSFMPEDHYGDYLILKVDIDTGQIVNWIVPAAEDIEALINDAG